MDAKDLCIYACCTWFLKKNNSLRHQSSIVLYRLQVCPLYALYRSQNNARLVHGLLVLVYKLRQIALQIFAFLTLSSLSTRDIKSQLFWKLWSKTRNTIVLRPPFQCVPSIPSVAGILNGEAKTVFQGFAEARLAKRGFKNLLCYPKLCQRAHQQQQHPTTFMVVEFILQHRIPVGEGEGIHFQLVQHKDIIIELVTTAS